MKEYFFVTICCLNHLKMSVDILKPLVKVDIFLQLTMIIVKYIFSLFTYLLNKSYTDSKT